MPALNLENLDDELSVDVCGSFDGGMNSKNRTNLLQANQAALLQNVDLQPFGIAQTRRGVNALSGATIAGANKVQGLGWYDNAVNQYLIAAVNAATYKWDGTTWSAISSGYTPSSSTSNVEIVQGINKVYFCDGSTNIFSWDGTTTVDLGNGGATQPPKAKYMEWHTNRLFAVDSVAAAYDTIYVSNILDAATWNTTTQSFRVGAGDGDPITGLLSWQGYYLLVFKQNSTYVVNTDPSLTVANWTIQGVHSSIGCSARRTICQVGADVWFLTKTGVRSVRRVVNENQNEVSIPISQPIQDYIDRINWAVPSKCCAFFWNNHYMLAVPLDTATEPNYVFVYNTQTQSWSGYWTGWTPTVFAWTNFSGNPRMVFGDTAGYAMQWRDYVLAANETSTDFQDNGTDITTTIQTRGLIFNEVFCQKKGMGCEFEFFQSNATANISFSLDLGAFTTPVATNTASTQVTLPFVLPVTLGSQTAVRRQFDLLHLQTFRELQIKIQSTSQKLALRSILAEAFVNTIEFQ